MEEEARVILRGALACEQRGTTRDLASAVRRRFLPFGGLELALPPRLPIREPPEPVE
jgi:plasmid stability protein